MKFCSPDFSNNSRHGFVTSLVFVHTDDREPEQKMWTEIVLVSTLVRLDTFYKRKIKSLVGFGSSSPKFLCWD